MIKITLPDGSIKDFTAPVTILEVAASIGAGLKKATLAGKVNGILHDASYKITQDASLQIITSKDAEGLEIIRHSCAHLLAHAVQSLFPSAQVTIGPVINEGFYYDFAFERPFTLDDLQQIEAQMHRLSKQNFQITRSVLARSESIKLFEDKNEHYKVEIIKSIPGTEELSFYAQDDFIDLCRGPHVCNTGQIKHFKLMKLAGAYWRGDSNNEMLQRIYGTAWSSKQELDAYLFRLEEAEKRDHRKLGKRMALFHFQEEAPGMIFWHANGWIIYRQIEQYIREKLDKHNYQEVRTPQLLDRSLWEKSGHWDKFRENMFTVDTDSRHHALKPMNCPCHVQIFNQGLKSYRDLPLRMAEFGSCHRYEPSGALHGIMRLRNFVQDDAHIFCTEEQIQSEVSQFLDLVFEVYHDFGFNDITIGLSTRPQERVGSDSIWDKSEAALETAIIDKGLKYELYPGEGAFYGPKIEFTLEDCLGRKWQCGTIQVDFSTPERLGATYVAEDSSKRIPVMLHRAILGSLERFLGILLEESAGNLPVWLAPEQSVILNIAHKHAAKCQEFAHILQNNGFRASLDLRNEKIGFKIREHTLQKVPYLLVVGDQELESNSVAVRARNGENLGTMPINEYVKFLSGKVAEYGRKQSLVCQKVTEGV